MDPPTFGINQNIPFIFQTPAKQPESPYPWSPPPGFSSSKAFPTPAPNPDVRDVDMSEASPPKPEDPSPEKSEGGLRVVATGALRRVYRARQKAREINKQSHALRRNRENGSGSEVEEESEDEVEGRAVHNTSNHYTLNMPSPASSQSDTPYVLLG